MPYHLIERLEEISSENMAELGQDPLLSPLQQEIGRSQDPLERSGLPSLPCFSPSQITNQCLNPSMSNFLIPIFSVRL